jgi:hypothetical protein
MSLTFNRGEQNPIAIIEGGSLDRKILNLSDEAHEGNDKYFERIDLDDGSFFTYPEVQPGQTDRIAVVGAPGARKSTFINKYLTVFHKVFPDAPKTILFTTQSEEDFDKAYNKNEKNMVHIKITEEILEQQIELNDLCRKDGNAYLPRCIVFDDYVGSSKKVTEEVERLRNVIACNGRKLNLYQVVAQTDLPVKSGIYREFLANCTKLVCFPTHIPLNLKFVLEGYFSMTNAVFTDFKRHSKSRWILITRCGVSYVLSETMCTIFKADEETERVKEQDKVQRQMLKDKFKVGFI